MHFVRSMPWLLKILCVMVALFKRQQHAYTLNALRAPFLLAVLLLASATLPSLCYSVRQREQTTGLLVQTVLFVVATGALACRLHASAEHHAYAPIAVQFLLLHVFYSLFCAVRRAPKLLLYPQAVQTLSACCLVGQFAALVASTPQLEMQVLPALALLFAGEAVGVFVLVLSCLMQALAVSYQAFFDGAA